MHVFDASSMIFAWDNYPISQFPPLWTWIAEQLGDGHALLPKVAFDETAHKAPGCARWLKEHGARLIQTDSDILREAGRIKTAL